MLLTKKLLKEINGSLSLNAGGSGEAAIELGPPSIDTRKINKGDTFFGIDGEARDGCEFFEQAIEKGAGCVVLTSNYREMFEKSEIARKHKAAGLFVASTRVALRQLGFSNRLTHSVPFVAVTGSNGKTTTKELIAAILGRKYRVFKTAGNFNNDLGLPMQLMCLDKSHEIGVVELGMSAPGEIDSLASLVLPRVGVITCVGPSHIEFLKTLKNIARAKAELIPRVDTQGCLILNYDNNYTRKMSSQYSGRSVGYSISNRSSKIQAKNVTVNENGFYDFDCVVKTDLKNYPPFRVSLNLAGRHNVLNALAAICAAIEFGVSTADIVNGLNDFNGVQKRMELIKLSGGVTVLNDCYNANPLSMKSALETVSEFKAFSGRRVAILGDMLELGNWSVRAHSDMGRLAAKCGVELLVTVGEKSKYTMQAAIEAGFAPERALHFSDSAEAAGRVRQIVKTGDFVLIKGSRGMKLEVVLNALQGEK
ncbi:MAG: hypothetical protein A2008_05510 [Candidatus Wallbacteria bacterium GWC2_49_35]|uniref:UDP-N-acetylmuramoyl-tripeptide--D-alanyl-D-alanine ligase n=1 Tax=Candidatus Wallbacteria bacterium GWC2_49_35 TaxID=1817813 RepID=A0A1F7WRD3_9BACT|nr:MAG: hypothetical protein A2008_05510 [Candidatus Wallbacteria bacterium GWC2_49_35]HBC73951.1 UDP-N-acetylmuramoyl-tripeptide--D-alanyl-D-alanine ligase [Candidatus Wallbacteria bacterium]